MSTISTETFCICDAAKSLIDDWEESDQNIRRGMIEADLRIHGITSPPEQVWFSAARAMDIEHHVDLYPQYEIDRYVVDFMLDPSGYFRQGFYSEIFMEKIAKLLPSYVIEIDGFEWHDKTKEQAENDKRRERVIVSHGYRVVRFAAREVFRDPFASVREVNFMAIGDIADVCARMRVEI